MIRNLFIFLTATLIVLASACTLPQKQSRGWSLNMRSMAESYEKLLPYLYDRQRYQDPRNEKFISLYLKNLNNSVGDLERHTAKGLSGNDPLFATGLKGLKTMIHKANETYFLENYDYSQKLLQASVQYCNGCHTRTNIGPTFIKWDQFEEISTGLNPVDHANVLVATRQFPQAVDLLEEKLSSGSANQGQAEEMLNKAMLISLRNLGSPSRALNILQNLAEPKFVNLSPQVLSQWKAYLRKWQAGTLVNKDTATNLLRSRHLAGEHTIAAIHNSQILHQALSTTINVPQRAQIYFGLGKIYSKYPLLVSWQLPETYYEACIYQLPSSQLALKCYYALESHLLAKTNSKSNPLLKLEKENLRKLKIMASEKKPTHGPAFGGPATEDI